MEVPSTRQQQRWMRQWQYAAENLPRLEYQELRTLTHRQMMARIDAVLSLAGEPQYSDQDRQSTSGLVEQQALFRKLLET